MNYSTLFIYSVTYSKEVFWAPVIVYILFQVLNYETSTPLERQWLSIYKCDEYWEGHTQDTVESMSQKNLTSSEGTERHPERNDASLET